MLFIYILLAIIRVIFGGAIVGSVFGSVYTFVLIGINIFDILVGNAIFFEWYLLAFFVGSLVIGFISLIALFGTEKLCEKIGKRL